MEGKKARSFCFTVNNYTKEHVEVLKQLEGVKYAIFGYEVGEQGTPHIQGFVQFLNPRSIANIVSVLPGHITVANGSPYSNFVYCSKDGKFEELGERPKGKGHRSDIDLIKKMVIDGASLREIWLEAPSYQAMRMAEIGMKLQPVKNRENTCVFWIYGKTGVGKTRRAFELAGDDAWISMGDLKWWEGYCGQKAVIIDDFRGDFCKFHELLRILDRYPVRVPVKNSSVPLEATTIIITSPYHPCDVYKNKTDEDFSQLLRRINVIEQLGVAHRNGTEVGGNNIPRPS